MRRAIALVVTGALACTPSEPATDEDTGDDPGETTDAEIPEPVFINPAIGEFLVDTNQRVPEVLTVANVIPGLTQVLLDGQPLGDLDEASPFGLLTEDTLELRLSGALIAGKHSLQLVNPSPGGQRDSVTLNMVIEAPAGATRPTWRTELSDTELTGTSLLLAGVGPGHVLALLGPGDPDPILQLLRPTADAWATDDPIAVPLDGHVPDDMSQTPAVSAVAFPEADGSPPKRMRVAWTVGQPGAWIAARDIAINPSPIVLNTFPAIDMHAALGGHDVEWSAFGRPVLLGHTLVAELTAAADTEVPHPGDRRVVSTFWRGDDLQWTTPAQVGMPTPTDLDALGPALIVPELAGGRTTAVSFRLGGAYPGLLVASDEGAVTISTTDDDAPRTQSELALATILGSFGGRTVASLDPGGRVGLSLLSTSGPNQPRDASPRADDLPDAAPTGAPAPGVALGFTVFLVPYGDAAPVQLVLCDGHDPAVVSLDQPDPVHCDAVALAPTLAGNDPARPELPFACLSGGALQIGHLIAVPADG